ncbi:hypothetical protein SARC_04790 [Sphaeroforma arctica JP610]|uniref:Tail specific protease domain-containing protein n=1 Tax=Sphaeroforma arctica JP610 TaxID=667725 RepID=A0A0L0G3Y8_9EUKA|nr:hypothetical protein SARC_04790 [Sphaeroforma arctica JP610]KNC82943.1 hypothetical protein SARC_04790 [Sphaeroforma arctica JP610]|eukprot:XP_014156845.1 hypothetical protein SARC_04790 [Sphaeroforma arctica JP610]
MQYPDMNDPFAEENCPGYYRYPCVHGDTVLFCCEDDLWCISAKGGYARRLTTFPGELKCVPAGESGGDDDDDDDEGAASRLSGVLDIDSRVLCEINPRHEWRQMFLETWRAMRDKYYSDNLNGVDWGAKRDLYLPLVARASCRSEVADILTELQSEMCTSHASAWGGDYKHRRHIKPGCLGADFTWSEEHGAYAISHIVNGDVWHPQNGGPLAKPAVGVRKGDLLVAINRRKLDRHTTPNELLLGMAYSEVLLSVMPKSAAKSDSKSKTKAVGKGTKTIGYGTGAAAEQPKKDMNGSINGSTKNAEHKSVGSVMTVPVAVTDSERDNDTSEEQRDSGTEMGVVRDSQTGRKILSKTNSSLGATVKSGREKHQTPNKGDNNIYESKNPGNAKTFGARKNSSVKKGAGTRRASTAPKQATTGGIAKESRSTPESSSESIRHIRVRCIGSDLYARYRDHIAHSRAHVRRTTNDRVGYIHLPDMERLGFSEFHRHFHTESRREGLIVDVRGNGGGYISELLLKSLAMPSLAVEISRYGAPIAYPTASVIGPVVMVCDEFTGSDGDCIVESFKTLKLGPVVGRRTWGGVVGTMDPLQLVDGSYTTQPEILILFLHKEAAPIENRGVEPDVHVIQTPQEHRKGKDTTLDAAVKVVMQKLAKEVPSFSSLMDQHRTPKDKPTIPKDWPFSMPALE